MFLRIAPKLFALRSREYQAIEFAASTKLQKATHCWLATDAQKKIPAKPGLVLDAGKKFFHFGSLFFSHDVVNQDTS